MIISAKVQHKREARGQGEVRVGGSGSKITTKQQACTSKNVSKYISSDHVWSNIPSKHNLIRHRGPTTRQHNVHFSTQSLRNYTTPRCERRKLGPRLTGRKRAERTPIRKRCWVRQCQYGPCSNCRSVYNIQRWERLKAKWRACRALCDKSCGQREDLPRADCGIEGLRDRRLLEGRPDESLMAGFNSNDWSCGGENLAVCNEGSGTEIAKWCVRAGISFNIWT